MKHGTRGEVIRDPRIHARDLGSYKLLKLHRKVEIDHHSLKVLTAHPLTALMRCWTVTSSFSPPIIAMYVKVV